MKTRMITACLAVALLASGARAATPPDEAGKPVVRIMGRAILREDCLSPSSGIGSAEVGLNSLTSTWPTC